MAAFVHPRAIHSWALCALLDFHLTPLLGFTVHLAGFLSTRMKYQQLYEHLIEDIRQLKLDFETLAAGSSLHRDAYFDAADMTKFILEKDEQRR